MNESRRQQLYDSLASRILILDGAMGTMLQAYKPTATDFGGAKLENCSENLSRAHPEWILAIHRAYLEAGADIIETNSFQGSPIVLAEFGLEADTHAKPLTNFLATRSRVSSQARLGRPPNRSLCGVTSPWRRCLKVTTRRPKV
jgi:5-methyltetrahydrofolate--homocysteine methyltransferase